MNSLYTTNQTDDASIHTDLYFLFELRGFGNRLTVAAPDRPSSTLPAAAGRAQYK